MEKNAAHVRYTAETYDRYTANFVKPFDDVLAARVIKEARPRPAGQNDSLHRFSPRAAAGVPPTEYRTVPRTCVKPRRKPPKRGRFREGLRPPSLHPMDVPRWTRPDDVHTGTTCRSLRFSPRSAR